MEHAVAWEARDSRTTGRRMTILAPEGMLGYGIPARSMTEGMKRKPDVLAVDAGSTDPGPYYQTSASPSPIRTRSSVTSP